MLSEADYVIAFRYEFIKILILLKLKLLMVNNS